MITEYSFPETTWNKEPYYGMELIRYYRPLIVTGSIIAIVGFLILTFEFARRFKKKPQQAS